MESEKSYFQAEQKEQPRNFEDLEIVTTTFYKEDPTSRLRSQLAIDMLEATNRLGINVVVVDGGSNEEFLRKVQNLENVTLRIEPKSSMGESRRQAIETAVNLSVERGIDSNYLWMEPEKVGLVTEDNLRNMIDVLRQNRADIIVPCRRSKETMPRMQRWIENRANKRVKDKIADITNEELDLWFGPKMFNRAGAEYFLNYKGKLDKWDSIIKPVVDAHQGGKIIASVPVDFEYTVKERENEEVDRELKKKRITQYSQILAEMGDKFWQEKIKK
ncbi:MAG: hypothetical protein WC860_09050 [Candidatus Margulisiibacteriota bacterium]|jgi:DNA repair photolyase